MNFQVSLWTSCLRAKFDLRPLRVTLNFEARRQLLYGNIFYPASVANIDQIKQGRINFPISGQQEVVYSYARCDT